MEHFVSFVHNMKKLTALLLFISINTVTYCSIIPPIMDTSLIFRKIRELVPLDGTLNTEVDFFRSITFLNDSICYYNPQGTLHVFEIKFDPIPEVKKLSRSIYHGHNFRRHNFTYDSTLFSYGGVGLFGVCTKLTSFDFKRREWFQVKIKGFPRYIDEILTSWIYNDTLHCIILKKSENEESDSHLRDCIYGKIDLANNTFYEFGVAEHINPGILKVSSKADLIFESARYEIFNPPGLEHLMDCPFRVFDKKNWNFFTTKFLTNKPCISGLNYCYVNDNKLFYRNESGLVDSAILTSDGKLNEGNSLHLFEPRNNRSNTDVKFVIYIFLFLIIIGLGMFFIRTRIVKKGNVNFLGKESKNSNKEIIEIERNLIQFKSKLIKRDDLDFALRIANLSSNTMKAKRSSLLKRIHKRGRVHVDSKRSPADKRNFEYYIS